jgi:transcriptional regulator with XRE-family HTH domain
VNKITEQHLVKAGWLIRCIRKEKGITQRNLALKANVSFHLLARIERGEVVPGAATIKLLAKTLKVPFRNVIRG